MKIQKLRDSENVIESKDTVSVRNGGVQRVVGLLGTTEKIGSGG